MAGSKERTVCDLEPSKLSDDSEKISAHSSPIKLDTIGYGGAPVGTKIEGDAPKPVGQLGGDRTPHPAAEACGVAKHEKRRVPIRWTAEVVNRDLDAVSGRDELGDRGQEDES